MTIPLVSVCVPNLNKRPFLPERMETLLSQTLGDWEMIVCDSYSDDGSWEFLQKYSDHSRIRLYQVPREGIYAGWNECVRRARGRYIYMATSDDTAEQTVLEKLASALDRTPDVDVATSNFHFIDEASRRLPYDCLGAPETRLVLGEWLGRDHRRNGLSEFVLTCATGHVWTTITSALIRRSLFDKPGLMFPAHAHAAADFEWALRVCLETDAVHVGEDLATLRVYPGQSHQQIDWAISAWIHVQNIRALGREFLARVPESCRDPGEALDRLAYPFELRAFNALHLYPKMLAREPARTLSNLGIALRRQPKLTLQHILSGARWKNRPGTDVVAHIAALLETFRLEPICSKPSHGRV